MCVNDYTRINLCFLASFCIFLATEKVAKTASMDKFAFTPVENKSEFAVKKKIGKIRMR